MIDTGVEKPLLFSKYFFPIVTDRMEEQSAHKVKRLQFEGRSLGVLCQDVNGPCPLLAIANLLLLRNQIHLPQNVEEVSQVNAAALPAEMERVCCTFIQPTQCTRALPLRSNA
jgi:hypothetical protein